MQCHKHHLFWTGVYLSFVWHQHLSEASNISSDVCSLIRSVCLSDHIFQIMSAILLWGWFICFGFFNKIQLTVLPAQHSHSECPASPSTLHIHKWARNQARVECQANTCGVIAYNAFLGKAGWKGKIWVAPMILLQAVRGPAWKCW